MRLERVTCSKMKILYIAKFDLPDFMSDMIFRGLRSLFGEDVVDVNEAWYMYDDFRNYWADRVPSRGMEYGRGFTLYGRLPKLNIDRTDIEAKIKKHYFDKIVYGSVTRYFRYWDLLGEGSYKPDEVVFIDGEDTQEIHRYIALSGVGQYFKREMKDEKFSYIRPINFCIPKELIVKSVPVKTQDWGTVIPGDKSTYVFTEEKPYFEDYQKSYFGVTAKKGGWDCLRHYEILMNGCIPYFPDLIGCPQMTMVRFPKKLVWQAYNKIKEGNDLSFYEEYVTLLLDWTRKYLTTESVAKYVLNI